MISVLAQLNNSIFGINFYISVDMDLHALVVTKIVTWARFEQRIFQDLEVFLLHVLASHKSF